MKKYIIILFLLILTLNGCGSNNIPQLETHTWSMSSIQSTDNNGKILFYGTGNEKLSDDAMKLTLTCLAQNGVLTITDQTNNESYTGTYKLEESNASSNIYSIVLDNLEGMAVVSLTTYQNGCETDTLVLRLQDYALTFFADNKYKKSIRLEIWSQITFFHRMDY